MINKKEFLQKYSIKSKFIELEKRDDDFWNELCRIEKHYNNQHSSLTGTMKEFISSIENTDINSETKEYIKHIHSIRYRIKDTESLLVKIIEKKYENINCDNKYNNINHNNYYKIVTDLIGIRIIVRYKNEWQIIHKLIWDKFYNTERNYIVDYEKDYFSEKDIFIAEQPIVYYRYGEKKQNYEVFGKNIFDIKLSDIGYSSIHYIINVNGTYIELQVRTIYDEAWSECDHDFVYKTQTSPKKLLLKRCSKILSDVTIVADAMSMLIKDLYTEEINDENIPNTTDLKKTSDFADNNISIHLNQYNLSKKRSYCDIKKVSDIFEKYQF